MSKEELRELENKINGITSQKAHDCLQCAIRDMEPGLNKLEQCGNCRQIMTNKLLALIAEHTKGMDYKVWAFEVIGCIVNDERVSDGIKREEIKCVLTEDGSYPESFAAKESADDAWLGEYQALADSQ